MERSGAQGKVQERGEQCRGVNVARRRGCRGQYVSIGEHGGVLGGRRGP